MEKDSPNTNEVGYFSAVLQQWTNHNVKMADRSLWNLVGI